MTLGTHAVKVQFPDRKVWDFVTPDGGTTRLRVHAATMSAERAAEVAAKIPLDNPEIKAKAVEL